MTASDKDLEMPTAIQDVLRAEVITGVVSRVAASTSAFLNLFNFQPGGAAVRPRGHRHGSYDIFNNTRAVARGAAPGAPAPRRKRQKVGNVPYVIPRAHDSIWLPSEELHNLRSIGGPASQFDEAGRDYIAGQSRILGQYIANFRTVLTCGMVRGKLYAHEDGDGVYYDYTSSNALYDIDWKLPAGNKDQLNMLGNGSIIAATWATASTDIHKHLLDINAAFQALCGSQLNICVCTSKVWGHVLNNDAVRALAGTSQTPFDTYQRQVGVGPDGKPINLFTARLRGIPWVEWIITDEGLDLGPDGETTFTKHIGDTAVAFLPEPRSDMFQMLEGSEPIIEYDGGPEVVRMGTYAWAVRSANPSGHNMFVVDNSLPAGLIPNAWAYGTVVF